MSVLKDLIKKQQEDFYLRKTTFLNHIPEQAIRDELVGLYNSSDELAKALGTIINAIYTDGKPTFFLSMRSLTVLLNEDKNLTYKGRTGIPTTNYRAIYAKLFAYFTSNSTFTIVAKANKEAKTPACIQLHDQNTLISMGNQIIIKLASNWHQQAVNTLSNLRKCHEITKQSQKQQHDTDIDTSYSTTNQGHEAPEESKSEVENSFNFKEWEEDLQDDLNSFLRG